jgi:putative ABC transport system substrate-binding protein
VDGPNSADDSGRHIRAITAHSARAVTPSNGIGAFVERTRFGWRVRLLALLLILSLNAACVAATSVVVVRTSDAEPYAQAETALREHLPAHDYQIRSVLIKDVAQKGIDAAIGKPDEVVAIGTSAARWLHKELPASIKLVYCMVSNAREAGLTEGRSSCGVTTDVSISEQFSLIHEALPNARVVGTLYRSDTPEGKNTLQLLTRGLPSGWRVESVAVNDYGFIADAIDALTQKNVDVIWTTADQKLYDSAAVRALLLAALRARIPVWGFSPAFVRAGALLGVGVEPRAQGAQAADLVAAAMADPKKAAQGPAAPKEFEIAVSLIVAEQLGINIPDSLSSRATYVYRTEK